MRKQTCLLLSTLLTTPLALAEATGTNAPVSNLQTSLILDAVAYTDDLAGAGDAFTGEAAGVSHGHSHAGHAHGGLEEGFNLREAELVLSATVDDQFDAYTNLAFGTESVEIEEAYFSTRALPAGWQLKGGKFFSGFGYTNSKHPHSWDFVDQNLAYRSLIGDHGLNDTGVQLTWAPATDTWMQFGVEALQGHEQEKFGTGLDLDAFAADLLAELALGTGDADADGLPVIERRGAQLYTGFFKLAPDLGAQHALQFGINYALHKGQQEMHEEDDPLTVQPVDDMFYADGEATLLGLEAVYKRAATGRYGQGALRVQAEYLALDKDLTIAFHTDAAEIGEAVTAKQDGFYVQGTYGFAPRWSAGLRYDATGLTNEITEGGATSEMPDSSRISAAVTFRPSEFSAWRLQVANADITDESGANEQFAQVMLQFNMSLGAHGAHTF
jgi:hypothetical protein